MIKVRRKRDGAVFSSDMGDDEPRSILAMHFCTSYTLVEVQDMGVTGRETDIYLPPVGSIPSPIDWIALADCDEGEMI